MVESSTESVAPVLRLMLAPSALVWLLTVESQVMEKRKGVRFLFDGLNHRW